MISQQENRPYVTGVIIGMNAQQNFPLIHTLLENELNLQVNCIHDNSN